VSDDGWYLLLLFVCGLVLAVQVLNLQSQLRIGREERRELAARVHDLDKREALNHARLSDQVIEMRRQTTAYIAPRTDPLSPPKVTHGT
jgi:hypothetical protein